MYFNHKISAFFSWLYETGMSLFVVIFFFNSWFRDYLFFQKMHLSGNLHRKATCSDSCWFNWQTIPKQRSHEKMHHHSLLTFTRFTILFLHRFPSVSLVTACSYSRKAKCWSPLPFVSLHIIYWSHEHAFFGSSQWNEYLIKVPQPFLPTFHFTLLPATGYFHPVQIS